MKLVVFLGVTLAVLAFARSLPVLEEQEAEEVDAWAPVSSAVEEHGIRLKRATCDLGSFQSKWFTPNHALCAAHCIARGFKGGNCQKTICHCRK